MTDRKNVEKSATRVLGKELVGKDGHSVDGKKDGGNGKVRRATFDDLDAIMDINDNIYDGFDYMPALFYTFMHSKQHAIYVYEEDGKLISLINFGFHENRDELVSFIAVRIRASHERRDLGVSESSPLRVQFQRDHPMIRRAVVDSRYTPLIKARKAKFKFHYHWNVLTYKLSDRQWLSRLTQIRRMSLGAHSPISLSFTKGTAWLERSDQLVRFVSKYVVDLFPIGSTWIPTLSSRSGLRYMLSVAKVLISLDAASNIEDDWVSNARQSPAEGHGQRTGNRGQDGEITGLSYSTSVFCKYGLKIDIFFYGDCETIFLSHVYSHLLHYFNIASDDVRLGVLLHFPLTIDSKNVEERLKDGMGERLVNDAFNITQAVLYSAEVPKAKL